MKASARVAPKPAASRIADASVSPIILFMVALLVWWPGWNLGLMETRSARASSMMTASDAAQWLNSTTDRRLPWRRGSCRPCRADAPRSRYCRNCRIRTSKRRCRRDADAARSRRGGSRRRIFARCIDGHVRLLMFSSINNCTSFAPGSYKYFSNTHLCLINTLSNTLSLLSLLDCWERWECCEYGKRNLTR